MVIKIIHNNMQDNFLNRDKTQAILDSRPKGVDIPTALGELSKQGFVIEGYNDKPVQSLAEKVGGVAKSALGGIAEGVGGVALTGLEAAGKAMGKPVDLHGQFQQQFGAKENPTAYGIGKLGGEVASLAAPVGALGKVAKIGGEALIGAKTGKLAQAATEGAAFTTGQGLQEGKTQSLNDYALNIGINTAFPVAGMVAKGVGENLPGRIINSLIKPLAKDFSYGKNPGKTVAELVPPANDFEGLISNIKTTLNDVGSRIGSVVSQSPTLKQIDLSYTLKPIDDAIAKASQAKGVNSTLIQRLETVKQDLVDNINNGIDPQSFKGLVGDLTRWTGSVSDDQAVNKALKQVYGSTRSQMDDVLSKELTPEQFAQYKKASEQYGNLLAAENAARYRDKIVERQDLISFGAKNAGLLSALGTAVATGGAGVPTILAGLAGAGVEKALATPAFKTRLASLLSKLAPKEINTFFDTVPTAKSLFNEQQIKNFTSELKKNVSERPGGLMSGSIGIPNKVSSLEQEAKKYKSAEEFIRNQTPFFHGSPVALKKFSNKKGGVYFTDNYADATGYSGGMDNVYEGYLNLKNPLIIDAKGAKWDKLNTKYGKSTQEIVSNAQKDGYDGVQFKNIVDNVMDTEGEGISNVSYVYRPEDAFINESQLTDIWNKAHGK